jgi:hypothetical protein
MLEVVASCMGHATELLLSRKLVIIQVAPASLCRSYDELKCLCVNKSSELFKFLQNLYVNMHDELFVSSKKFFFIRMSLLVLVVHMAGQAPPGLLR